MRILMIHNEYASLSGEEVQFYNIADLFKEHDHEIFLYTKSSSEIADNLIGKGKAFFSGIYNFSSIKEIKDIIRNFNPDLVFIQNLYPLISPAILPVIDKSGIPIIMRVANYRLTCPNGLHLSKGTTCESCKNGGEYWCVIKNCEDNLFKSIGYAIRNAVARYRKLYRNNISAYICASNFLKSKLVSAGFPSQSIHVVPNIVPDFIDKDLIGIEGNYIGYAGRISKEKGIDIILKTAKMLPDIPFRFAGKIDPLFHFPDPLPDNVKFVGFLGRQALQDFYSEAKMIITASICYETFGISIAEAMLIEKPVIAPRSGVFPEFVKDKVTGILCESNNAEDFADSIRYLWNRPNLRKQLGRAGREFALGEYSVKVYYKKIMKVLNKLCPPVS